MTSITWKHGLVLNRLRLRWQLICDRNDWCTRWQLFCHFFFYIDFLNPIKCKKEKKFIVQSFLRTSFCKTWKFLNVHRYLIFNIFLINGNISSYEIVNIFFFFCIWKFDKEKNIFRIIIEYTFIKLIIFSINYAYILITLSVQTIRNRLRYN